MEGMASHYMVGWHLNNRTASDRAGINADLAVLKTRKELMEYMGRWRIDRRGEGWDEDRINNGRVWLTRRWHSIHTP